MTKVQFKNLLISITPNYIRRFRHLRYFSGWKDLFQHIKADKESSKMNIVTGNHLFFISGLPKSGTTWLEQLLSCNSNLVKLNESFLRQYPFDEKLEHPHDLVNSMFACAPKNRHSFLKLHPNPSKSNFNILQDNNVKTVILIRDIRDVLISGYFHSMNDKNDFNHDKLKDLSLSDGLIASMKSINHPNTISEIEYYSSWINGWIERANSDPSNTLIIKYEDMHENLEYCLKKIFHFYEYKFDMDDIASLINRHKSRHKNDYKNSLKNNLLKKGSLKSTFRKGNIGEWKNYFVDDNKYLLKKYLSDILVKSGYEKNDSW